jgi:hypothetical protein
MKTHIIDGEEYEECDYREWILADTDDTKEIYLRKVKKKIEFPVRVDFESGSFCEIKKDGYFEVYYSDGTDKSWMGKSDLQKLNEKMKELEDSGAFL